jgi:hypothetical protein
VRSHPCSAHRDKKAKPGQLELGGGKGRRTYGLGSTGSSDSAVDVVLVGRVDAAELLVGARVDEEERVAVSFAVLASGQKAGLEVEHGMSWWCICVSWRRESESSEEKKRKRGRERGKGKAERCSEVVGMRGRRSYEARK